MAERVPGIDLDDTEGSIKRLSDSICLIKLIVLHNDPVDDFNMDEHQIVQIGHQFKDGVTFMALTTPQLLNQHGACGQLQICNTGTFLRCIQLV